MQLHAARWSALVLLTAIGCTSTTRQGPPPPTPNAIGRGTPNAPKAIPIPEKQRPLSPARQGNEIDDRTLLIPPPPSLEEMTKKPVVAVQEPESPILLASNDQVATPARVHDEVLENIQRVQRQAAAAYAKLETFEARLTRRETINGKPNPQETIAFKFRKEPYSVRLTWLASESKGRDVIFVQGQHGGKMHIMPSKADSFPLPPMRMAFLPDDSMVRSKTRHDIRQAGLGEAVRQLGNVVDIIAKDPVQRQRLRYLGQVTRPECAAKMEAVEEIIAAKTEPLLPQGGKRVYFFDTGATCPSKDLPVLVIAYEIKGKELKEVEYYCFDNMMTNLRLDGRDFDPDLVWSKK